MILQSFWGSCSLVWEHLYVAEQKITALAIHPYANTPYLNRQPLLSQGFYQSLQLQCRIATSFLVEIAHTAMIGGRLRSALLKWETPAGTGFRAGTCHGFSACRSTVVNDSFVLTSGLLNYYPSMARCSRAVGCHWDGHESQNARLTWILLLGYVACLSTLSSLLLSSLPRQPKLQKALLRLSCYLLRVAAIRQLLWTSGYDLGEHGISSCTSAFIWVRGYFPVVKIDDYHLTCQTYASSILYSPLLQSVIQCVLANSTLIGRRRLHESEMSLNL